MDVNDYMRQVRPAGKRSRIAPFLSEIQTLRERGFSLEQVREFLSTNGVEVSVGGLSAYLSRQGVQGHPASPVPVSPSAATGTSEAIAQGNATAMDAREQREAVANRFISSQTQNTILKRIQEKHK